MSVGGEVFGRCLGSELRGEVSPGFGHCFLCDGVDSLDQFQVLCDLDGVWWIASVRMCNSC